MLFQPRNGRAVFLVLAMLFQELVEEHGVDSARPSFLIPAAARSFSAAITKTWVASVTIGRWTLDVGSSRVSSSGPVTQRLEQGTHNSSLTSCTDFRSFARRCGC